MKYPSRGQYDTAVRNLDKFVFDNILKHGKPVMQANNPHLLRPYSGGKAIVYEIQTNPKKYALKCWVEDLGDLKVRYKEIDEYFKQVKLPYFVDFSYHEQGILVEGQRFPIIRMEWVNGIDFKRFISNNINNPVYIRDFAEKFLEMIKILHQNSISHGDLQHGNIMARQNGDICLIDYDSLYVPKLSNEKDSIKGLPGYQHPHRNKLDKLSPKSDYFSELVMYLSLLAISEKPSFWQNVEQEQRLLFTEKDFANPRSSSIFAELTKLSPEIVYFTLELEKFCRQSDIEALQPLETIVNAYGGSKFTWDFEPNGSPNLSTPNPTVPNDSAWDGFTTNTIQPSTVHASTSDPWKILDTNLSSPWDKLDGSQATPTVWDKLDQTEDSNQPIQVENDNTWNKFDTIWNKFLKTISSTWNRFLNWLN
jgi:serine/threonine protein kinase